MRERPILFQGAMVRALLAGTKTQTRRAVKMQLPDSATFSCWEPCGERVAAMFSWPGAAAATYRGGMCCPYGEPGDRLWVRESHWFFKDEPDPVTGYTPPKPTADDVEYRAGGERPGRIWRPSIHMPRWASRITLEVTEVRVQRLQATSEEDALAEGIEAMRCPDCHLAAYGLPGWGHGELNPTARGAYRFLWESINGAGSWDANPWVWAVSFRRVPT